MSIVEPARERIVRQLRGAVDRLRDDMNRVEFWTDVLGCLAQPIPDYDPGGSRLNQFRLPRWSAAAPRNGVSASSDTETQDAISPLDEPSNTVRSRR